MAADETRERLAVISGFLRKTPNASETLLWAADAIDEYLSGRMPSLDHAFGLKRGRGAPPKNARDRKNYGKAFAAFKLHVLGEDDERTTLEETAEILGLDPRRVTELIQEHRAGIIADLSEQISAEIVKAP